jgi:hypothetical protein
MQKKAPGLLISPIFFVRVKVSEKKNYDYDRCTCEENGWACDNDEQCSNRALKMECKKSACSPSCQNQQFQQKKWKDIALVKRGKVQTKKKAINCFFLFVFFFLFNF